MSARRDRRPSSARTAPASPRSMNTISGLLAPARGPHHVSTASASTACPPTARAGMGIAHVLERRRLFPFLTVLDNVLLGAHNARARAAPRGDARAPVEALFPLLETRRAQLAHTLSGGEQQMVAIARGLMARPRLLMIDEPFLGLAPRIVEEIGALMRRIRDEQGIGILFIEQNVELSLRLADRGVHPRVGPHHPERAFGRAAALRRGEADLPRRIRRVVCFRGAAAHPRYDHLRPAPLAARAAAEQALRGALLAAGARGLQARRRGLHVEVRV